MEAIYAYEMLTYQYFYQTSWSHIPEDRFPSVTITEFSDLKMLFVFVNEIQKKKPSSLTPDIIMNSTDLQIKLNY
jgi:hypothetical protein